jgi:hypothetical protein
MAAPSVMITDASEDLCIDLESREKGLHFALESFWITFHFAEEDFLEEKTTFLIIQFYF